MEEEVSTLKKEKETLRTKLTTSQGEKAGMIIIIICCEMKELGELFVSTCVYLFCHLELQLLLERSESERKEELKSMQEKVRSN